MNDEQRQQMLEEYAANDMIKLRQICNPIIQRKDVPQMEYDDLYSVALDTLMNSVERYDSTKDCSFNTFLTGNIKRRFYDWTRDNTRLRRCNLQRNRNGKIQKDENNDVVIIPSISIDAPTEDGIDICEKVASEFKIEDQLSDEFGFSTNEKIEKYLEKLSSKQKEIAKLIMEGYQSFEIREKLKLAEKRYAAYIKDMSCFEKSIVLRQKNDIQHGGEGPMQTQTSERSKERQYSILSLIKKIEGYTFRFDHPTQRESGRWSSKMKGNLISDILQNNPLPNLVFAEQIIDGIVITWNLDGKQKCTNVYDFYNGQFKVCKNVRRWNIKYQSMVKDEGGNVILSSNGLPQIEQKTFDIRGKKFSDLPNELQERFCDYTFQCTQYLNCSDEDIEYHICRYNEGKPLNGSEKGMGEIGTKYAAMVKEIAAMPFFTDRGGYKMAEFKNGTVNRVVVESIMAINFLKDWKKQQEEMCFYMKEHSTEENFDNFTDLVERMESVVTESVSEMFNSKDSFVYFGLFARFIRTGLEDKKFIEFMAELSQSLHKKEIDGVTFNMLSDKSTKDKNVVISKIEHLEKLMIEFLNINEETKAGEVVMSEISTKPIHETVISILDFVKENVNPNVTDDDIKDYEEDLEVLSLEVDNNSNFLERLNHHSLIALIAHTYQNDIIGLEKWFPDFFERNPVFKIDQVENYLYMKRDLEEYVRSEYAGSN